MPRRRKLTEEELLQRKIDRHNAKKVDKGVREAPLFADSIKAEVAAESWTTDYLRFRRQRVMALAMDGTCASTDTYVRQGWRVLDLLTLVRLRRVAATYIPADVVDELNAYFLRVYPDDYQIGLWCDALTGRRFDYKLRGEPIPGRNFNRVVVEAYWPPEGWPPPFDRKTVHEALGLNRWPNEAVSPEQPDDGGAFELLQQHLRKENRGQEETQQVR